MSFQITLSPSGKQFSVEADETVLTAALRQGIGMPYGCKNGACGSCKSKILAGEIVQGAHQPKALSEEEQARGLALFCCAHAKSDVTIECRELTGMGDIPIKRLPARVASMQKVSHDVMLLRLQLPATERFQYLAGQYIEFLLRDGKRRSYSMGNAPHAAEQIELHIRHMPGGVFTDQVFGAHASTGGAQLKERDIVRFEGPLGTFFLREDSNKPMILLASGTGFAPIKALVEHMQFKNITRPTTLYWGGRRPADCYMHALCLQWAAQMPHFNYVPVISDALPEDHWQGRTGFVHRAVMEDFPDLSAHQVYACGAPIVVDSARTQFNHHCQLPEDEFFADSFVSEADSAKVA